MTSSSEEEENEEENSKEGMIAAYVRGNTMREQLKFKYVRDEKFNPDQVSFSLSEGDIPSAMNSDVLTPNS